MSRLDELEAAGKAAHEKWTTLMIDRSDYDALLRIARAAKGACEDLSPESDDAELLSELRAALEALEATKP